MGRKVSELEQDIDPIADMLILVLARRLGLPVNLRQVDALTDMAVGSSRLPEFASPDPRVSRAYVKAKSKVKRKVSPYQKEFGRQLKKLKKKHPKTKITKLMRRAHIATRKVRK